MTLEEQIIDELLKILYEDPNKHVQLYHTVLKKHDIDRKELRRWSFILFATKYFYEFHGYGDDIGIKITIPGVSLMREYGSYESYLNTQRLRQTEEATGRYLSNRLNELELKIKQYELSEKSRDHRKILGLKIRDWGILIAMILSILGLIF